MRVGKEKSSRLAHLDEIGVLECDFALYYFLDEGLLKLQLAEDLWSKYIIMEYAAGGDLSGQFSKDNESGNLVEHPGVTKSPL